MAGFCVVLVSFGGGGGGLLFCSGFVRLVAVWREGAGTYTAHLCHRGTYPLIPYAKIFLTCGMGAGVVVDNEQSVYILVQWGDFAWGEVLKCLQKWRFAPENVVLRDYVEGICLTFWFCFGIIAVSKLEEPKGF